MAYEWERGIGTPGNAGPIGDRYYGPQEWAGQDDCGPGALRAWPPTLDDAARGVTSREGLRGPSIDVSYGRIDLGSAMRPSLAGRGPRGYRRSPERIQEDVCEALTWHPDIDASEVDVTVTDECEVILSGRVPDRCDRRLAEDIAARVSGVVDVRNRLRVPPSGSPERSA